MTLFHPLRRCVRCTGQSSHLPLRACSAIVALCLLADLTDGDKPLHYIQVADSQILGRGSLVNDLRCRAPVHKNFRHRPREDWHNKKSSRLLPFTATRCPIRSFNLSGLSMLKTLWLNSLTNTTCSPSSRHFFLHCSWPTPAPLPPHFESLTQPFSHLSLGPLDFAGASTANGATSNNTQPTEDSFFI